MGQDRYTTLRSIRVLVLLVLFLVPWRACAYMPYSETLFAGTVFRPKKPSYAPTGYQKDLGDMAFATNRTKAAPPAACTENAAQHQGLALLSSVIPSVGVSLDAGGDGGSGGSGSFSPVAAADYRMLSALMAARGH